MFFTEIGVEQFSIVLYISLSLRTIVQSRQRQQQKCKNGTRRTKLQLYFLSEIFFLLFIFKLASLLKFIHFSDFKFRKKKHLLTLLVFPGLPHILTLIIDFIKRYVVIFLGLSSGKAFISILERFEIKGWQNDECLSIHIHK